MTFSLKKVDLEKQGSELASSYILGSLSSGAVLCPLRVN